MNEQLQQLQDAADIVRNETQKGANTAVRIGGLFGGVIDFLANVANIRLSNLSDSLNADENLEIQRKIGMYAPNAQPKETPFPNYNDRSFGWIKNKIWTRFRKDNWQNYHVRFGAQNFPSGTTQTLAMQQKWLNGNEQNDGAGNFLRIDQEGYYFCSFYINNSIGVSSKMATYYLDITDMDGNVSSHVEAAHQFPSSSGKLQIISVPDKQIYLNANDRISLRINIESATTLNVVGGHLSAKKVSITEK